MTDDFDDEAPTIPYPRETMLEVVSSERPTKDIRPPRPLASCRQRISVIIGCSDVHDPA